MIVEITDEVVEPLPCCESVPVGKVLSPFLAPVIDGQTKALKDWVLSTESSLSPCRKIIELLCIECDGIDGKWYTSKSTQGISWKEWGPKYLKYNMWHRSGRSEPPFSYRTGRR